jgi:hypothetical protein
VNARRSLFCSLCLYSACVQSTLAAVTWTGASTMSQNWIDPDNWNALPPNGPNTTANFPAVVQRFVFVTAGITVGTLNFTSGDS